MHYAAFSFGGPSIFPIFAPIMRIVFSFAHIRLLAAVLFASSVVFFSGCEVISPNVKGEGPVVEFDKTPAQTFAKLLVSVPGNVYISEGAETKVTLIAQENVEETMRVVLNGDDKTGYTLEIASKKPIKKFDSLAIYITVPNLINISVNSDADLASATDWTYPLLTMTLNGSGSINVSRLSGDVLAVDIPGSGEVDIKNGSVADLNLKATGSGSADLTGMRSQNATVTHSGSGLLRVNAVQELKVTLSGSGSVEYRGNPYVEQTITGTGTLTKI